MTKSTNPKIVRLENCTIVQADIAHMFEYRCPVRKCNNYVVSMVDERDQATALDMIDHEMDDDLSSTVSILHSTQVFYCSKHGTLSDPPNVTYRLKMTVAHESRLYCVIGYDEKVQQLLNEPAEHLYKWILSNVNGATQPWQAWCRQLEKALQGTSCQLNIYPSKPFKVNKNEPNWWIDRILPIHSQFRSIIDQLSFMLKQYELSKEDDYANFSNQYLSPADFKFIAK
ncbi:hypothetical protein BDF19DRAFT_423744 [Syncephalis fuscata]|nr:hypothetical protein BDF19DRAFT_423744 [Syncephalis fuscata]